MGAHVLSAGNGYTYLTGQVAAHDVTGINPGGLGAYYAEQGEAPGQWLGSGLTSLGIEPGSLVSEAQMVALFGEGRHPDSAAITSALLAESAGLDAIEAATALGTAFKVNVAANEFTRQVAVLMAEWNTAQGAPASAPVPDYMKARIRTAVGQSLFAREHGREAADARELSGFINTASRIATRTVAGYDLTFSPVKSVSVLWALAPAAVAEQIQAAHQAAVQDTIGWLERTAAYTRLGRNGIRQVDVRGLVATAFVHRTSRAGDPDLHTHVAVSNKVQTLDGKWRALDGRVLLKATVAASERYNTRLEAELRDRLGVRFAERPVASPEKRSVREIVGVDPRLLDQWSGRRKDITERQAALSASFQAEHGRPPTPVEAIALAQQATLAGRQAKQAPRSEGDQRAQWHEQAIATLTEPGLAAMVSTVLTPAAAVASVPTGEQILSIAQRVIDRVQADRATWQRWHVIAEAQRQVRRLDVPLAELESTLDAIVDGALADCSVTLPRPDELVEPEPLRRADGTSVYVVAGSQLFSSRAVLAAEQSLLRAAGQFDGRRISTAAIEMALLEATANGLVLNEGQVAFVRELAGSGARCQLALAPAGTGKTTALQVLTRAWTEDGSRVLALAPSAAAARQLAEATGAPADTLAKGLHDLAGGDLTLTADTLIVIDEAGMASTPELARLTEHALRAGASVRLVGDDRQLAAIGAGGILRDLAETTGAVSLAAAVRFADPAEADAALAIRDGSATALDFYTDRGRVSVGDAHTAAESAYQAWATDRAAGRESLLLAATREQVAALNTRARADRLANDGAVPDREIRLIDGTSVSAGDPVITRRNDRRIGITATDWVKNGDRWTVQAVHGSGALTAVHRDTGRHVLLPAGYVAEHVALGYATTIHAAQGSTADTCHTVLTGNEAREQLYVAISRGRHANHVHVVLPGAADEHAPIRRDSLIPPTAIDLLQRVLDREASARSATTEVRATGDLSRRLAEAVDRYTDALTRLPVGTTDPTDAAVRPLRAAPLPWLPPVPAGTDGSWREYLLARGELISDLSEQVSTTVTRHSSQGAMLNRADKWWQGDNALWRVTHPDNIDLAQLTGREQLYARHLHQRYEAVGEPRTLSDQQRWLPLVGALDPHAVDSPHYPALAHELTAAFGARLNVDRVLPTLLAEQAAYSDVIDALAQLTANERGRAGAAQRALAAQRAALPQFQIDHAPDLARGHEPLGL